jgi:hypothetical protein
MRNTSHIANNNSTPTRPRKAQDYRLRKIEVTRPHRKTVLAERLAKTSAFDGLLDGVRSAMCRESKTPAATLATHSNTTL